MDRLVKTAKNFTFIDLDWADTLRREGWAGWLGGATQWNRRERRSPGNVFWWVSANRHSKGSSSSGSQRLRRQTFIIHGSTALCVCVCMCLPHCFPLFNIQLWRCVCVCVCAYYSESSCSDRAQMLWRVSRDCSFCLFHAFHSSIFLFVRFTISCSLLVLLSFMTSVFLLNPYFKIVFLFLSFPPSLYLKVTHIIWHPYKMIV